jgi:integrase
MVIVFSSVFAPLLEQFVEQKVSSGFKYESSKKILRYFDLLCIEIGLEEPILDRGIVQRWSVQRPTEGALYRVKRVSLIRQFALFLISRGYTAYIASTCPSAPIDRPHIFRDEELVAFFSCCEQYQAESKLVRVALPVLFRFYHCLGLRLNESLELECNDLDLGNGRLYIRKGKGLKDRVLYLPADLLEVARQYNLEVGRKVPGRKYFFVSDLLGTGLRDTSVCRYFDSIWAMTEYAGETDKKPTIHCFRHTMVVRKLEQWYREKEDYTYWLPYLCAFLGHSSLKDTYHYIHLVDSSFPVIRDSMQLFEHL